MEGKQVVEGVVVAAPGNVAAPEVGAEMPVISKERWEDLQRWRAEGQTVSQMARVTGLDRKTVRSCLRKTQWLPYRRPPLAETVLSAHRAWLEERAPEVNYSARILFQELRATRGYEGGYDTVRNAVRPLRREAGRSVRFHCVDRHTGSVDSTGSVHARAVPVGPAANSL
ncbi:MAG: hypothetical protein WKH97_12315 [Casimicrobiaceae bacterium]